MKAYEISSNIRTQCISPKRSSEVISHLVPLRNESNRSISCSRPDYTNYISPVTSLKPKKICERQCYILLIIYCKNLNLL